MIKNVFTFFFLMLFSITLAQNKVEPDQRLLSIFPQEKLDHLKLNAPKELAFMNYMLDNALDVVQISSVQVSPQDLPIVKIEDTENLNFYALKLNQLTNSNNYYLIKDTELILSVKPYNYLKEMFIKEFYKD